MADEQFLRLLKKEFKTVRDASVEIINLKAILSLPKGTEYFFSDLHGEHEAFIYMLKSASGVIREKIDWLFQKSCSQKEREQLAELIYYPSVTLKKKRGEPDFHDWCKVVIYKLIEICKQCSNKYTRSKVRKRLPKAFGYIMDELLHAEDQDNKSFYYSEIVGSLIDTGMAEEFIIELGETISRLAVDRLHILGDLFDRGPHADYIMDYLINYDNVDFQWGNHDIAWMGAAMGNWACIANVLRVSISYNNFDMLEIGYGLNLRPLSVFASQAYKDDPCTAFLPHVFEQNKYDPVDAQLAAKMHKAIAVIQFKVEAELSKLYPHFNTSDRILLDKIDFKNGTVCVGGVDYPMSDMNFPTVDPENPLVLTEEETDLMERLSASFVSSKALKKHIGFLFSHGSLYKTYNGNLLYHGCIPMTEDGEFEEVDLGQGRGLAGKAYLDYLDEEVRKAYFGGGHWEAHDPDVFGNSEKTSSAKLRHEGALMWYLWSGGKSPLFGKNTITTFQRYFIEDKKTHHERLDYYYAHINRAEICVKILQEFGLSEHSHIVNGHLPVKKKQGESPVKGGGRLFVIDGGMAKSYQRTTGIAGYTLIFNSRYLAIAEHKPFSGASSESPKVQIVEFMPLRITVGDTDIGIDIKKQIEDLECLIEYLKQGN